MHNSDTCVEPRLEQVLGLVEHAVEGHQRVVEAEQLTGREAAARVPLLVAQVERLVLQAGDTLFQPRQQLLVRNELGGTTTRSRKPSVATLHKQSQTGSYVRTRVNRCVCAILGLTGDWARLCW